MPSVTKIVALGLGLMSAASAAPNPAPQERHYRFQVRQAPAGAAAPVPMASTVPAPAAPAPVAPAPASASSLTPAPAAAPAPAASSAVAPAPAASSAAPAAAAPALTDVDIAQFALTLEHLESNFYSQGFARFPDSDFAALGLTTSQIANLKMVGMTEATHVNTLSAAITQNGATPVQACTYNYNTTIPDAKTMVATARVLEAVGISAYAGAAPLINSSAVLSLAASIITIESRHQSVIRLASGAEPVPAPFDTALGPRAVFTLAAQFIQSCPQGSNLNIQAFPSIKLTTPAVQANQQLVLQNPSQPTGAMFCTFINQAMTQFTPLTNGACTVPPNMAGEVYMMVTSSMSAADSAVLAGPSVLLLS